MLGVFLDTETNGLDWSKHIILEISFIIKNLLTGKEIASYTSMIKPDPLKWKESDPSSLSFTQLNFELLTNMGKNKTTVQREIENIFKKNNIKTKTSVFICQNPSFDRSFFSQLINSKDQKEMNLPYHWLDLASMYWVERISANNISEEISVSKDSIALYYKLPKEKNLTVLFKVLNI